MSDESWKQSYWGQLFDKRYWREVVIGLPPKEPWAPTAEMYGFEFSKTRPSIASGEQPISEGMVVACNEAYLELADGAYMRRGFGGMVYTLMLLPIVIMLSVPAYAYYLHGFSVPLLLLSILILVLGGPMFVWMVFLWKQDMLGYTYKPMRLVRATRRLHVFRHNGPDGVWSLDWDKLTFTLKKGGLLWGVLGYLPDENEQVTHAFYLGAHLPVGMEGGENDDRLCAHWEYFRRYMEDGPSHLPPPDQLLPIENRREPFLYGVQRLWGIFGPFSVIFLPVTTLAALFRWAAMRMSRLPRWPDEIEAECRSMAENTAERSPALPVASGKRALVGIGTVLMLALDVVLLWLLLTRVFGIRIG